MMGETDALVPVGTPIDLDTCAREPIHIPGSVQPRGVLLVVHEPALTVNQVSANLYEVVGIAPEVALGAPLSAVLGVEQAGTVARATAVFGDLRDRNPLYLELAVNGVRVGFDAILHREPNGLMLIELEVASGPRPFSFPNTYLAVRGTIAELNQAATLDELYEITAKAVRELTGFDRVMVYRYDEEYNGEVVAEARPEELNSFLGLHYPASDIPAQARALYEQNWIRLISDVEYVPAPLVPIDNPVSGRPMDLTHATLRSVSPIHVEYLKNMGVGASMSISLLRNGKLWGLIACHQYSGPHVPPYGVRAAAEFLGSALSLRLVDRHDDEELRARLATQAVLARITSAMQVPSEPLEAGLLGTPGVLDVVAADGVALDIEGRTATNGAVPEPGQLAALTSWLLSQGEGVVVTDCLSRTAPQLALDTGRVCGLLAIVLRDGQYVVWFRTEATLSVDWGGDPGNKAIAVREGDEVRVSPRKSFERWRETVRLRSVPWTEPEQADAAELRQRILEVLYTRAESELRLAETLQRSLLPDLPDIAGWTLSASYQPAAGGRIGGDWYDAFRLPDGRLVVALGDVAGHGIGAAGTMAQLRNALRAYLVDGIPPVGAIDRLNRFMTVLLPTAFATVAVLCIDVESGSMNAVMAGHPIPLLIEPGAAPVQVALTISPPVGVPGARYAATDYTLARGSGLVLFSDGLVERRAEDMTESLARLASVVGRLGEADGAQAVFASSLTSAFDDDATVVVVRRS